LVLNVASTYLEPSIISSDALLEALNHVFELFAGKKETASKHCSRNDGSGPLNMVIDRLG
jgi:hypothetical protein